jgi:hypothetical protein
MGYSPILGRWLEPDPSGYVDGPNLYGYERSDPVGSLDPLGLQTFNTLPTPGPPSVLPGLPENNNPNARVDHIRWATRVPPGIVHYRFTWDVYDCECNEVNTEPGWKGNPDFRGKMGPGEEKGQSEYYFYLEKPSTFALLNSAIGNTGEGLRGNPDRARFMQNNGWKGRQGVLRLEVEIRGLLNGDQGMPSMSRSGVFPNGMNNVNQIYYGDPGSILDHPLFNGGKRPADWDRRPAIARYTAEIIWNGCGEEGTYSFSWEGTGVEGGFRQGKLTPYKQVP